jgi:8-oxo-dGTP pyrophosphatase MutT (NUDIX family)
VRQGLAGLPPEEDPEARLLERVLGTPSAELLAELAAPRREAAVLIGLVDRGDGPCILLTERAAHLAHHPGQISLPGGRLLGPDESPIDAALREAGEEVGLAAAEVEIWGRMPAQLTVTGFSVTPVVGWLAAGFSPEPDPAEVQSIFELPLAYLLAAPNRGQEIRERLGSRFAGPVFVYERYRIWGATALILARFLEVIDEKT